MLSTEQVTHWQMSQGVRDGIRKGEVGEAAGKLRGAVSEYSENNEICMGQARVVWP